MKSTMPWAPAAFSRGSLAVLHAAAFVLLPVAVLMPLWTTMVAAAAALAMLVVAAGGGVRRLLRVTGLVVAALVLALAWAAITAMWAVEPDRAVKTVGPGEATLIRSS